MKYQNLLACLLLATIFLSSFQALAAGSDNTPIEVGLFPPLQIPNTDFGVRGLRLSIVGLSREVYGLDIGILGSMTDVEFKGIAISGLFNYNRGGSTITGLQLAALANLNPGHNSVYGLQIACYNSAESVYGLQLGLVNVASNLHGIQIGLVNVNKNGLFHVTPIINAGF